jgi:pyruvate dehydrogenase E2 component (dihydrolipoamide acetyltransferase)
LATLQEVLVPDIGDFKEVEVIEVLVKPGDSIKKEDSLIALESDKATMEVPSPVAGTVKELKIKVGDKVSQGSIVLVVEATSDASAKTATATASAPAPAAAKPAAPTTPSAPAPSLNIPPPPPPTFAPASPAFTASLERSLSKAHASPSVRAFARELGVDLGRVTGSGPKGRILKEDIQQFVKSELASPGKAAGGGGGLGFNLPPAPAVDFAKFGPIETKPLSRIKKISGANLHRNWLSIPHITQHEEADITELEAFRQAQSDAAAKSGVKLTLLAFILKGCVAALKRHPEFNASLAADGENLVLKNYYHLGFACDTPDGLVVPVIRDVDQKGIFQIAKELAELSAKAREKKLSPSDMQGGTFSVSSLGGIGGTQFTPIINAPEVAILGASRSAMKPVWQNGQWVPRMILPLSLSYDHRVIDGALGARFITYLSGVLADMRRAML